MKTMIILGYFILVGSFVYGQGALNDIKKDTRFDNKRLIIAAKANFRNPEVYQKTQNFVNFRSSNNSNKFVSEFEKINIPENAKINKMKEKKKFNLNNEFSHRQFSKFDFESKNHKLFKVNQNLVVNNDPFKQKMLKLIDSGEIR